MSYISHWKIIYKENSKECYNGEEFDDKCYYSKKKRKWEVCTTQFCNIHGLPIREEKARTIERRLRGKSEFANTSINFGYKVPIEKQKKCLKEFFRLIKYNNKEVDIINFKHWEENIHNKREKHPNYHQIIAANYKIPRLELRKYLTQAATSAKITFPSSIRLGYNQEDNYRGWLVYCMRIGIYSDSLVLPPPGERWEICRLGAKHRKKNET